MEVQKRSGIPEYWQGELHIIFVLLQKMTRDVSLWGTKCYSQFLTLVLQQSGGGSPPFSLGLRRSDVLTTVLTASCLRETLSHRDRACRVAMYVSYGLYSAESSPHSGSSTAGQNSVFFAHDLPLFSPWHAMKVFWKLYSLFLIENLPLVTLASWPNKMLDFCRYWGSPSAYKCLCQDLPCLLDWRPLCFVLPQGPGHLV